MSLCFSSRVLSLLLVTSFPAYASVQQLVPVVRQLSPGSSVESTWKTYIRIEEFGGESYVSLVQMAGIFDGTLRWLPVSKAVELSLRGHTVCFGYRSAQVKINGKPQRLGAITIKNEDGMWVPLNFFGTKTFYQLSGSRLDWPPPPPPSPPAPVPAAPVVTPKPAIKTIPKVAPTPVVAKPVVTPKPKRVAATKASAEEQALKAKAIRRVVIDPGHGGKDPGTMGPHGVEEKAINLLMAQELAEQLRNKEGYEVLLTRTDDSFIPLAERAELANRHNADIFISLHCNASLSPKLRGFEVYFLSESASDPHADATARLENAPLALEGKAAPTPKQLEAVLRSLVKNANINESSALGAMIDRQVGERSGTPSLGVKQAAFYVLRGAEMPAVLVEMGFLTNAKEEKLLQSEAFRKRLIDGIMAAIKTYDQRKQKERR